MDDELREARELAWAGWESREAILEAYEKAVEQVNYWLQEAGVLRERLECADTMLQSLESEVQQLRRAAAYRDHLDV